MLLSEKGVNCPYICVLVNDNDEDSLHIFFRTTQVVVMCGDYEGFLK